MLLSQNNVKEIPEERVCVLNGYPIIEQSLKESLAALKKLGIPSSQWKVLKKDVKVFFYFYCVQNLYKVYNNHKTTHRKVFAFYTSNKNTATDNFIKNNLDVMLKSCTFPWCKVNNFTTPELGSIAARAFERQNTSVTTLVNFLNKNNLNKLTKRIKKNFYSQKNSVDFSWVQE